jgi:tripartite-type tricarboxylate transporter receptor subunit TctC
VNKIKTLLISLVLVPLLANAWEPTKPIRAVIPFGVGSFQEVTFRAISKIVETNNPGVTFIIETKAGADGVIGTNALMSAIPDGYTISPASLFSTFVTQDIFQRSVKKYNYDSFSIPLLLTHSPLAVIAKPHSKVNTPTEFVKVLKDSKDPVNVAVGGGPHKLAYDYIMDTIGNNPNVKSIPHQGPLQAAVGVASDQPIEFGIMPLTVANSLIQSGKVKLIGITGEHKPELLPSVLLVKDAGLPNLGLVTAGSILLLPKDTPQEIIDWYTTEFSKAILSDTGKQFYRDNFLSIGKGDLTQEGVRNNAMRNRKAWDKYINGPMRDYN